MIALLLLLAAACCANALIVTSHPSLPTLPPSDFPQSCRAFNDAFARLATRAVPVPSYVSDSGSVSVSYIKWSSSNIAPTGPPLILVHGFDSSCLEFRRLGPALAALGREAYAVDVLGWGFSDLSPGVKTFGADAKVAALEGFVSSLGSAEGVVVVGASLGGAAAIELAAARPEDVVAAVLIDAQGFVDGVGPMASLPRPLAGLGVDVLGSRPLRSLANRLSYHDKEKFATEDALLIGRLHTRREGWKDALVSFMRSGGFSPSGKVGRIKSPTLVLWGRQDGILDGEEYAGRFVEEMEDAELQWVEECGHVPHLEQSEVTAKAISNFLEKKAPGFHKHKNTDENNICEEPQSS